MMKNKVDLRALAIRLKVSFKSYWQVPSIFLSSEIDEATGLSVSILHLIFLLIVFVLYLLLFSMFFFLHLVVLYENFMI